LSVDDNIIRKESYEVRQSLPKQYSVKAREGIDLLDQSKSPEKIRFTKLNPVSIADNQKIMILNSIIFVCCYNEINYSHREISSDYCFNREGT